MFHKLFTYFGVFEGVFLNILNVFKLMKNCWHKLQNTDYYQKHAPRAKIEAYIPVLTIHVMKRNTSQ